MCILWLGKIVFGGYAVVVQFIGGAILAEERCNALLLLAFLFNRSVQYWGAVLWRKDTILYSVFQTSLLKRRGRFRIIALIFIKSITL